MSKSTLDVLREARAALVGPDRWCKGALENGDAHCAYGALALVGNGSAHRVICSENSQATYDAWKALTDMVADGCIVTFNNADSTTQADVLALFDKAIAAEETRNCIPAAPETVSQATPRRRESAGCERTAVVA